MSILRKEKIDFINTLRIELKEILENLNKTNKSELDNRLAKNGRKKIHEEINNLSKEIKMPTIKNFKLFKLLLELIVLDEKELLYYIEILQYIFEVKEIQEIFAISIYDNIVEKDFFDHIKDTFSSYTKFADGNKRYFKIRNRIFNSKVFDCLDLKYLKFENCEFNYCRFENISIFEIELIDTKFKNCYFDSCNIFDVNKRNFLKKNLDNMELINNEFDICKFQFCKLYNVHFYKSNFINLDFSSSYLDLMLDTSYTKSIIKDEKFNMISNKNSTNKKFEVVYNKKDFISLQEPCKKKKNTLLFLGQKVKDTHFYMTSEELKKLSVEKSLKINDEFNALEKKLECIKVIKKVRFGDSVANTAIASKLVTDNNVIYLGKNYKGDFSEYFSKNLQNRSVYTIDVEDKNTEITKCFIFNKEDKEPVMITSDNMEKYDEDYINVLKGILQENNIESVFLSSYLLFNDSFKNVTKILQEKQTEIVLSISGLQELNVEETFEYIMTKENRIKYILGNKDEFSLLLSKSKIDKLVPFLKNLFCKKKELSNIFISDGIEGSRCYYLLNKKVKDVYCEVFYKNSSITARIGAGDNWASVYSYLNDYGTGIIDKLKYDLRVKGYLDSDKILYEKILKNALEIGSFIAGCVVESEGVMPKISLKDKVDKLKLLFET